MNNKVAYIICCINKFADRYGLSPKQSYAYLQRFRGVAFLDECYEAEHQVSLEDAVEDLTAICKRNGGQLG
ncbi:MAG: DUF3791 domain-containing protein [Bacteroidales bacterium]|nr:DUF3791 domain-containing protein [Bacteroidales bacterium]